MGCDQEKVATTWWHVITALIILSDKEKSQQERVLNQQL